MNQSPSVKARHLHDINYIHNQVHTMQHSIQTTNHHLFPEKASLPKGELQKHDNLKCQLHTFLLSKAPLDHSMPFEQIELR